MDLSSAPPPASASAGPVGSAGRQCSRRGWGPPCLLGYGDIKSSVTIPLPQGRTLHPNPFRILSLLPLAIPVVVGPAFVPLGLLSLGFAKLTYWCGDQLVVCTEHGGLASCECLKPIASLIKTCFGWLSSVSKFGILDGAAGKRIGDDLSASETGSQCLAGGLACWFLVLSIAPAVIFDAWGDAVEAGGGVLTKQVAVAYEYSFHNLLALRVDWTDLLPSLDQVRAILDDPEAAFTEVLGRVANAVSFANFDPSYYMEGMGQLDAFSMVLSFLRLLAVYGRKAFAAINTLRALMRREQATDGTVQVHECLAPPVVVLVQAAIADLGSFCGLSEEDMKEFERSLNRGQLNLADKGRTGCGIHVARVLEGVAKVSEVRPLGLARIGWASLFLRVARLALRLCSPLGYCAGRSSPLSSGSRRRACIGGHACEQLDDWSGAAKFRHGLPNIGAPHVIDIV